MWGAERSRQWQCSREGLGLSNSGCHQSGEPRRSLSSHPHWTLSKLPFFSTCPHDNLHQLKPSELTYLPMYLPTYLPSYLHTYLGFS